jgi:hypothetical protein
MIELPRIDRHISDLPRDAYNEVRQEQEMGRANKRRDRVSLLPSGHLNHFMRTHGIPPHQEIIDELCDHLDATLPETFDEPIVTPALPPTVYRASELRRGILIGQTSRLPEEQDIIRKAVEDFFEQPVTEKSWPTTVTTPGYEVASFMHRNMAERMAALACEAIQTTMPEDATITYEPVSIKMVPPTNRRHVNGAQR